MVRCNLRTPRPRLDLAAIRAAHPMPDVAARLVPLKPRGGEWIGCCPFHHDRAPSFTLWRAGGQDWRGHCFGCGWQGDVLDLVRQAYGLSLRDAAMLLGAGEVPMAPQARPSHSRKIYTPNVGAARSIFAKALPIAGTLAETYLRGRGLAPPWPDDLRFAHLRHPDAGTLPCVVAGARDVAGEIVAIQRIFLASDGRGKAAVAQPKMSLGPIKGASIHLREPGASDCLVVCEGPEDGLSLLAMLGLPVWVAAGAGNLAALEFPPGIRSIVIGADNDATGRREADKAAAAHAARDLAVRILYPQAVYKDFNAEWQGVRHGVTA